MKFVEESNDASDYSVRRDGASVSFHTLPQEHFVQLSRGDGSPEVIEFLWNSQLSRRFVLLRAVHDEIKSDVEIQAQLLIGESWRLLRNAHLLARDKFTKLIMVPQVGSLLAYVLRRARGGTRSQAPRHIDYGMINSLALSAAALAGLPFTTTVPLRNGRVMLPCFGMAHFEGCERWETADAGVAVGQIWLRHNGFTINVPLEPGADAVGWWGLRHLSFGDGPTLTVSLNDIDPMRDMADPVAPARLTAPQFERWTGLLGDAWAILCTTQPELTEAMAVGVTSFVPLPAADGWDTRSASTGDAFGAVLCSPPPDAVTLAVALAHEFMHIKLGGLMHLLPMSEGGDEACLYAPWRDDPRPLGGLIQGIYAFVGIATFWRRYRERETGSERNLADFEYAYARVQATVGLTTARNAVGVTAHGTAFLEGLEAEIDSWEDELPDDISDLARLVANGHQAGWRIRHCEPDKEAVAALAEAWAGGSATYVHIGRSAVRPDPAMRHWSQARLGLARRRIVSKDRYTQAGDASWGAALTDGDLALFAGEAERASEHFLMQIADDAGAVDAWTGLGLALSARAASESDRLAGKAILDRPEVIMAAYLAAAAGSGQPPSPIDLAAWVGAVVM